MTKYKQQELLLDTEMDELGRRVSLNRFTNESKFNFKNRVYLCTLNNPRPTLDYYTFALNNHLNLFQKKIFKISLIDSLIDVEDLPRLEVDGVFLRVWKNMSKDPVLEINLHSEKYKFLSNVKQALETLNFLTVETIDYNSDYYSKNLIQSNSDGFLSQVYLETSEVQRFDIKYIEKYMTNNPITTLYGKQSTDDLNIMGDYYLDKLNGILYTSVENNGFADIMYQDFPFYLEWSPAKILELNDKSIDTITKDKQVNEDGEEVHTVLNSYGSNLINRVLEDNKIYWDK